MKLNKIIIVILSLLLTFLTICGLLFKENSKEKINLIINVEKENINENVYINEILINDNSYLTKNILKYDEKNAFYVLKNEKLKYTITKNDNFYIEIEENNVKNIEVIYDDKELNIKKDNSVFTLEKNINSYEILKKEIKETNILYVTLISIAFIIFYFLSLSFIFKFINKLYNDSIKIYEVFISLLLLFIIYYFSFYPLIILTKSISMVALFLYIAFIIYKNRNNKNFNLETNFLLISIFLGITMLFLIPPFYVLDEDNHYIKVYDHLFYLEEDKAIENGVYISNNVYDFRGKYQNNKFVFGQKINALNYYNDLNTKIDYKNLNNNIVKYGTHGSKKLAYIPANIVTFICKRLNTNVLLAFLLARLINYSLALIICYKALKLIPKFKPLLFVIMTFAITYHSIMGINQDWLNTTISFLMIAYIMHLIFNKEFIEKKDYIILGLLSYALAFAKTVYTPLILLVLFIDNKKFKKNIKHPLVNKVLIITFACFLTLLSYFWNTIFDSNVTNTEVIDNGIYTFTELIKEPLKLISIYFNTIKMRLSLDLFRGYFDGFGWYIIWHNSLFLWILKIIYAFTIFTLPNEEIKNKKCLKLLSAFIFISMYGIITASMLFGWCKRGTTYIDGLQSRYFIPVVFYLYLILNNNILKTNKIKNYNLYLTLTIIFTNFLSFFTIIYKLF